MKSIKVSVIVPVYNLQSYVELCIDSLLKQKTDFNFEVIAIDDCSTDNSWSILERLKTQYSEHFRIYRNSENKGLALTMKALLERVKGKYICYLDGDDLALPGKLQQQADYLDKHKSCFMVYHELDVFDSETNASIRDYSKDYYNNAFIPQKAGLEHLIRYGCFVHIGSVMLRNHEQLLDTIDTKNKIILDHPWLVLNQMYGTGSIDFIDRTLGRYRIHNDSFGGQTRQSPERKKQATHEQLHVCDLASEYLDKEIIAAGKQHYLFAAALFFLRAKEDDLFQDYLDRSTDGQWFFNQKHEMLWSDRKDTDSLRENLYPDCVSNS